MLHSAQAMNCSPRNLSLAALLLVGACTIAIPLNAQRAMHTQPATDAASQKGLALRIEALLADPPVSRAQWGISVTTIDGQPIFAMNDGKYFTPASNAKLFTTAAALAILGPDFVSKTYVVQEGTMDAKGVLKGGLRVVGTGDPSLSFRVYPYKYVSAKEEESRPTPILLATTLLEDMVGQVMRHGIREVDGPITGDDSFFVSERYGTGWGWDDLQWEYGAPVSALTFNDNITFLDLEVGANAGDPIASNWRDGFPYYATDWNPAGTTTSPGTKRQIGVERDPGSMVVRLFGTAPVGGKPAHLGLAVERPAMYAAAAFRAALEAHGIHAPGPVLAHSTVVASTAMFDEEVRKPISLQSLPPGTTTLTMNLNPAEEILATHVSPPLSEEATVINKVSENLHAELLLRLLGRSQTGEGSFVEGARVVRQFLVNAGVLPDDFFFYDGSGMSPQDEVTPRATSTLLAYAARQPWGNTFRATLPIAGVDGTLANRFTQSPVKGKLFAKTGTLNGVHALSGYLKTASGRTVIVAIYCNHREPGNDAARKAMDKITETIYLDQ
jgi:serine-type D-Ala-D-Ala carboxypeptidase/endopeptidase (penicillin-binding protein 4)